MDALGTVTLPGVVLLIAVVVVLVLIAVIWSIKRHRDPELSVECDATIDTLIPSLAGLTLGGTTDGNRVDVFENGAFFDVLLQEIASAKCTVHFETFLWKEGALGQRLADALSAKAQAGVTVRVLLDANGTRGMGKDALQQLKDAGCKVAKFHDWRIQHIGVWNERDHRKLVRRRRSRRVRRRSLHRRHLARQRRGQGALRRCQRAAARARSCTASRRRSARTGSARPASSSWATTCSRAWSAVGDVTAHAAFVKPEGSAPTVKILHHAVICCARKKIWIQNPYFIPEPEAIDAFGEAVDRGVDVRVMMPSTSGSDNPMVQHAGHRNFEKLLRCGVRLFEYPHTLLHQKVMTVDGIWCAVGSTNFDDRSFEINDEITLCFKDEATTRRLDAIFEKYAPACREIQLDVWSRRSWRHKLVDNAYYLFNEVM